LESIFFFVRAAAVATTAAAATKGVVVVVVVVVAAGFIKQMTVVVVVVVVVGGGGGGRLFLLSVDGAVQHLLVVERIFSQGPDDVGVEVLRRKVGRRIFLQGGEGSFKRPHDEVVPVKFFGQVDVSLFLGRHLVDVQLQKTVLNGRQIFSANVFFDSPRRNVLQWPTLQNFSWPSWGGGDASTSPPRRP
jgi:hypothetical protein